MDFRGRKGHIFENRGDPSDYDFKTTDLTTDYQWHDLDLSGIVPAGVIAVEFIIVNRSDTVNKYVSIRSKGNVNSINVLTCKAFVANIPYKERGWCFAGPTGEFEYFGETHVFTMFYIVVTGWIKST